jgi:hypothetical protein
MEALRRIKEFDKVYTPIEDKCYWLDNNYDFSIIYNPDHCPLEGEPLIYEDNECTIYKAKAFGLNSAIVFISKVTGRHYFVEDSADWLFELLLY